MVAQLTRIPTCQHELENFETHDCETCGRRYISALGLKIHQMSFAAIDDICTPAK